MTGTMPCTGPATLITALSVWAAICPGIRAGIRRVLIPVA
jgi:hypothetical protein